MMKKTASLILVFVLLIAVFPAVHAEAENDPAPVVPEFSLDSSALPFVELQWNAKLNTLAKALSVRAEKDGKTSVLNSVVSIDGFGGDLPVRYTFRNNKLVSVKLTIKQDSRSGSGFFENASGKRLLDYLERFISGHPYHTYLSEKDEFRYTVTDVTEMNYGLMKSGDVCELTMEFFPAQKYDTSALEKSKKVKRKASDDGSIIFCDSDPALFTHDCTSKANRFSYSFFQWYIMMSDAAQEPGRMPALYFSFTYNGTDDCSGVKQLKFTIVNDVYIFKLRSWEIGELSRTAFGELSQTFIFRIDSSNYEFLEKLAKGKKVKLTMKGTAQNFFSFLLFIDLSAKVRQKLVEGMKNYEKVCGLVDGPLAFSRFYGTPLAKE